MAATGVKENILFQGLRKIQEIELNEYHPNSNSFIILLAPFDKSRL